MCLSVAGFGEDSSVGPATEVPGGQAHQNSGHWGSRSAAA